MVLWKDLDPAAWPDDGYAAHRLLSRCCYGAADVESPARKNLVNIDAPGMGRLKRLP
jgi:hypothetical protein